MSAPKKKNDKKQVSDFLKDSPADKSERISGSEIFRAASMKNETTRRVLGFLLLAFSFILTISFVSFFFSWKSDQSFLADGDWDLFKENQGEVANVMGLMGAKLGYFFVHNGFGIAAFFILPYLVLSGMYLLLDYRPFSLLRILIHSVLFMGWFSLFLGFAFQWWFPLLGGTFGYFGVQQLQNGIGIAGTVIFLITFAVLYSFIFLNANPFVKLMRKTENPDSSPEIEEENLEVKQTPKSQSSIFEPQIIEDDFEDSPFVNEDEPVADPFEKTSPEIEEPEEEEFEEEEPEDEVETAADQPQPKIEASFKIEDLTQDDEELLDVNLADVQSGTEYGSIDSEYDPRADLSGYRFPTLDLLKEYDAKKQEIDIAEIERSKKLIEDTLGHYKIGISTIMASVGPTVTLYEIVPAPGVKISKIKNLEDDIALSLAALGIRIIAPIPGKGTIGIEVPNRNPEVVPMRAVLASKKFQENDFQLPVALGKTISNEIFVADLAKMPHLLMAGATGQGKSVGLNAILVSLLYKKHPAYIKFVLVDPKKVELTLYNKIERHFLAKLPGDGDAIITDNQKVIHTLNSLCVEMDDRYKLLQDAMVRNIVEYNSKFLKRKLNP
ncbi:MAG: hypothetical protein RL263_1568, partial [Bacteroidota bacterium]